jgi:hypothetical protein
MTLKMHTWSHLWSWKVTWKPPATSIFYFGAFSLQPIRGRPWETSANHSEESLRRVSAGISKKQIYVYSCITWRKAVRRHWKPSPHTKKVQIKTFIHSKNYLSRDTVPYTARRYWILIYWLRNPLQAFCWICIRIRLQVFMTKMGKLCKLNKNFLKTFSILFRSPWQLLTSRRSLQPSKENIQVFKHERSYTFLTAKILLF